MATGITIGAGLTTIAQSLVKDIVTPVVFALWAGANLEHLFVTLKAGSSGRREYETVEEAQADGAVTLNLGLFATACLDFVFMALAVFVLFTLMSYAGRKARAAAEAEAEAAAAAMRLQKPHCELPE